MSKKFEVWTPEGASWERPAMAGALAFDSDQLFPATPGGMMEPHLLVEAVRDDSGRIVDLRVLVASRSTLDFWGLSKEEALGEPLLDIMPRLADTGLFGAWVEALETGNDLVLSNFAYENTILDEMHYFDIGAARTTVDWLSISWNDVTARQRAAQAVEDARRHYQLLAENASDVVFRSNAAGIMEWLSPSVTRVLGWEPSFLIGRPLTDLSHPFDRELLREALGRLATTGSQHVEIRLRLADRGQRWMAVTLRTAVGEDDGDGAMFGTFRDIDAEVTMRRSLREEQARFEAVRESSTDAIISVNRAGLIVGWNRAAVGMLGYEAAEAQGQSYVLVVPPRLHEVVVRWLNDLSTPEVVAATKRTHRAQFTRKDGSEFPCEYSVAVWDRGGEQHMTAILRDVTEQQAVMDALQQSRRELSEAQLLAGAGSWTYDPRTEEWQWSDELLRIYGVSADARPDLEALVRPLSDGDEIVAAVMSALAAGRTTELECFLTRADGEIRRMQAKVAPVFDVRGEITMIRGTAVDVTDLYQATEARARRTARHADYLSRVEHTLRTHLSVVEGWAGILEASFDELDPATRLDAIGAIKRNASALVGHVKGLMSEAAQHAKADTVVVQPLDVAEVAAAAAADYRGLSGRVVGARPSSGVWAMGSRDEADTVVRHLIENALRHTGELGCVEVLTRHGGGAAVEVIVRDDGPGIAAGVQLFTPFSKESRSSGHGLGLHVVRTLVEAMGGTVEGHNRDDGPGAEFIITLRGLTD
ncbi:PAS domain S-box protein [Tessaracoccus sp.]